MNLRSLISLLCSFLGCRIGVGSGQTENLFWRVEQDTGLWAIVGCRQEGVSRSARLGRPADFTARTPMNVQALAANSLHVGSGGAEAFYEATERGLDLVMIGGIINGLTHDIVAGKKYNPLRNCAAPHSARRR